ncbi:MAG: TIGR01212 family radical SAM protein [Lachnospiraceae bacterium]|nr:TIGR01212 family radical SAM protein [Lachnospiraceae bacterium]
MQTLNKYLKNEYGRKLYKLALDAGFSCPNRDGFISYGGCSFCSEAGSGDFAESNLSANETSRSIVSSTDIPDMIENAKTRLSKKFRPTEGEANYIAYFQSFTNTYAPVDKLRELYEAAINHPDIAILSIATRPDCVSDEVISLIKELNKIKPVWIELGLQTIRDDIASSFNRGYKTETYDDAVRRLNKAGIKVITHVILGLPNESEEDMLLTIKHVIDMKSWGIKLQLLHLLKGTRMAKEYEENPFHILTFDEYLNLISKANEIIPDDMVVHRLTGDGPRSLLIEPKWSTDKKRVLNAINKIIN